MLDWDDLRHFLAVARHGSTIAAARSLGVSQSTVQRRLACLDAALGRPVASRTPSGYVLTPFGASLLPHAEAVEAAADHLTQVAEQASMAETRRLRITCPEPIVIRLTPLLERFQNLHPDLHVELMTSDRYLDLSRGDADIAFRSGDTDADLFGRKIADSTWAVYARADYVQRCGAPADAADLRHHALITLEGEPASHRVLSWLAMVAPGATPVARVNSVLGLLQAARSGIGVAPLPANIADAEPDLVRVLGPVPELARTWKLLTPKVRRREPKIAAFFDFIADHREAVQAVLG